MTKIKKKIKGSLTKRFKVTKTGKVMFVHQYGRHHKLKKSNSRIRRQKEPGVLAAPLAKKVKKLLGFA
jgi:large subunit ribosomal protein L35